MFKSIKLICPRGHLFRTGRITPGLSVRIKASCPVCGELRIASGIITPFCDDLVSTHKPDDQTAVTSRSVRRELQSLAHEGDASRLLKGIPIETIPLRSFDVMAAMEVWIRHRGRAGGALPEPYVQIEVLHGTNQPEASAAFVRRRIGVFTGKAKPEAPKTSTIAQLGQMAEVVAPRAYRAFIEPLRQLPSALGAYLSGRR